MKGSRVLFGMEVPALRDPHWLFLFSLTSFAVFAVWFPGFRRSPEQLLASLLTCVGLELVITKYLGKKMVFPLSAWITSTGTLLLTDTPGVTGVMIAAALGILSKQFIVVRGHHVFNPANFGVLLAYFFFTDIVTLSPGRWGGSVETVVAVLALGVVIGVKANRLYLSMSFVASYFLGCFLLMQAWNRPLLALCLPMTGAAFYLFSFFMITDPKTSPERPFEQLAFGFIVAALATVLRFYLVVSNLFVALFVATALYSVWRNRELLSRA